MAYKRRRFRPRYKKPRSWGGAPSPKRLAKEFLSIGSLSKSLFELVMIAVRLSLSDPRAAHPPRAQDAPLFFDDVRKALRNQTTYPSYAHVPLTPKTVMLRVDTVRGKRRPPIIVAYSTKNGWKRPSN